MSINLYDNDTIRWEHGGRLYLLHVHSENCPDNPRDEDGNVCVMACWHRRYTLGDKNDHTEPELFWRSLVHQYVPYHAILDAARNGELSGIRIEPIGNIYDVYERWDMGCPFDTDEDKEVLAHQGLSGDQFPERIMDDLTIQSKK